MPAADLSQQIQNLQITVSAFKAQTQQLLATFSGEMSEDWQLWHHSLEQLCCQTEELSKAYPIVQDPAPEDKTEGKKFELYSRQSFIEVLNKFLLASSDQIYILNHQGQYLYASATTEAIFGIEPEAFVGKTWRDLGFPKEMMERFDQQREWVFQFQKTISGKYQLLTRLGQRDYEYILSPIHTANGDVDAVMATVHDITDRSSSADSLRVMTTRLQALITSLQAAILVEDEDRKVLFANQEFCRIFAIPAPPEALVGMDCSESAEQSKHFFTKPDSFVNRLIDILQQRQTVTQEEWQLVDGRTLERDYVPIFVDESYRGHLWVYRDISERKKAEDRIKISLREKEVLLKEIHHRVKNNLQIISSLLKLQASTIEDENYLSLFRDSYNRVHSMALLHEKLYQTEDLANINAADYIRGLTDNLSRSYYSNLQNVQVKLLIDPILLDIDTAVPCGLIVNELMSNSLKYAFPAGQRVEAGEITIEFRKIEEKLILKIQDNGVGLPPDFVIEEAESLGLQLVTNLTEQLDGDLEINREQGTCFKITFTATNRAVLV